MFIFSNIWKSAASRAASSVLYWFLPSHGRKYEYSLWVRGRRDFGICIYNNKLKTSDLSEACSIFLNQVVPDGTDIPHHPGNPHITSWTRALAATAVDYEQYSRCNQHSSRNHTKDHRPRRHSTRDRQRTRSGGSMSSSSIVHDISPFLSRQPRLRIAAAICLSSYRSNDQ